MLRPTGVVITGLGGAQAACAIVGGGAEWWASSEDAAYLDDAMRLAGLGLFTSICGLGLHAYGRRFSEGRLTRREAILAVVVIWTLAGVFGALPFAFLTGLPPVDAFFETMSGLTTTGTTVITGLEHRLSRPMHLWRATISWLGGMGIVVLCVAILPSLGAGAKHMFKGEVTGTSSEGLKPRIAKTSFALWRLYTGLTVVQAALLVACGFAPFEALCHAFTTISTSGFSTRDASLAAFESPAAEYVAIVFMLLGSLNFALFFAMMRHRSIKPILRSVELRVFFGLVALATAVTMLGTFAVYEHDFERTFRMSLFHVASCASSTGYFIGDELGRYPSPVFATLLGLMIVGGCAGSTAGGMKVERVVLLAKQSWSEVRRSFRPAIVRTVRMGRAAVSAEVMSDVAAFFVLYVAVLVFGVLIVSILEGLDLRAAFGATLACLGGTGPAPWLAPELASGFEAFSDAGKLFLILIMVLGRLELFTLFALLVPDFWRR